MSELGDIATGGPFRTAGSADGPGPNNPPDAPVDAVRLRDHTAVSTALALLGDRELGGLVAAAVPLGTGIGGRSALVEVEGRRVFVKRVPLTDLELRPEHVRSTANLFGLPSGCQYGVGRSPGFGAWRELAVHTMTTDWALGGEFSGFPLLHHWRVLPDDVQPLPAELADVDGVVAHWGGSPQVRGRLEALRTATASLTLFLEYVPHTLHDWLGARIAQGDDSACARVERWLDEVTAFLPTRQLVHFDAHFTNVLTDGHRLCLADYGLALSSRFELAPAEREFFERHRGYDRAYAASYLVNWLVTALFGYDRPEREAYVRACAAGGRPEGAPPVAAGIIARHAPTAVVVTEFLGRLRDEGGAVPYPYASLPSGYRSWTASA